MTPHTAMSPILADTDFQKTLFEFASNFLGALGAVVLSWLGVLWVWSRRRAEYRKKSFMQQVNFSLNDVQDDMLVLRTLLETSAHQVWQSDIAVNQVLAAAAATKESQPFIVVPKAEDMAYLQRAVINALSQQFASTFVAKALKLPVKTGVFLFGITFEKWGAIRTQKLRVMLIEKDLLITRFGPNAASDPTQLKLMSDWHRDRITTLQIMAKLYLSTNEAERSLIRTVELGVPV